MTDKTKKAGDDYLNDDVFTDEQSLLTGVLEEKQEESGSKRGRGNQGFASMSKQKQREIASKGGKAAHEQGTAHEWTSEEAAAAGRRGGQKKAA